MKEFSIGKNEAGQRFDKYLRKLLRNAPDGFLYRMLRKKNITLNGRPAKGAEILSQGDCVRVYFSDETFAKFSAGKTASEPASNDNIMTEIPPVLYEDEDLVFFNKPAGLAVQGGSFEGPALSDLLIRYLTGNGELTENDLRTFRPSPMNRLDRNTSGIVLCGKSLAGLQFLAEVMRDRSAEKLYRTICVGVPDESECAQAYHMADPDGKTVRISMLPREGYVPILTGIHLLGTADRYSELGVHLITGRKHQIRAYLAAVGHPVAGDMKYGDRGENRMIRERTGLAHHLLHAESIRFGHVDGAFGRMSGKVFTAPVPEEYKKIRKALGFT